MTELDPFAKLLQESTDLARAKKAKRKNPQRKATKRIEELLNIERDAVKTTARRLDLKWIDEAIVLLAAVQYCRNCGNELESVNPHLMVKRTNSDLGTHYIKTSIVEICERASKLPRKLEYTHSEVARCPHCFFNTSGNCT